MRSYKFSIIMSTYKGSSFIEESIKSVINQSYKNWELLIVDNGSTDNTTSIVESFTNNNEKIVLIKQEHKGVVDTTTNTAIKKATGDFCQILDSGDYLILDCLQNYVKILKKIKTTPEIIIPIAYGVDNDKNKLMEWNAPDGKESFLEKEAFLLSINLKIYGWFCIKSDLLRSVGYEDTRINVDELTTRTLFYNAKNVAFSTGKYFYRINPNETMGSPQNIIRMYDLIDTSYALYKITKLHKVSIKAHKLPGSYYVDTLRSNVQIYIDNINYFSNEKKLI